ncbi:DeoR/GlpR family DNA-binding transcription regulator [Paenibacillus sacheonensis]|uniref:DeoR family transcriptional regulator n=1 Tax=Paenibacillus sacheonensis TaxID=742054 RepID=A0A7X4YPG8_9BACL|nr:DeoR/GlpR family DNA-binding transcription regulator [Paenibacillus sacheonensis]MBM7565085.1 DeoR family transcriptional regulator of aga operon/DeoR family myo-inositol catabolism operon transcriptional repressor [Paenibacillus sacheonensis]NBC70132.1 DeoR family transcriptional regulator [Paenibacillus sacheonensis]
MIVIERRHRIKERLLKERSVKVADLVREFNVSEETVRRDLNQLEKEGLIVKNYGGAVLADDLQIAFNQIPPVEQRKFELFEEKDAIGAAAASLVRDGQIVILDSGSTAWCVARYLKALNELTVVTNGVNIAEECASAEGTNIFLLGGKLIKKSMSIVGPQAEAEMRKYNADYVFLGTSGISLKKGFTSSDPYEAEIKRAMIESAQQVVVVADHSKFSRQALLSFSGFDNVDMLITSDLVEPALLQEIEAQGVKVIAVPVGRTEAQGTE